MAEQASARYLSAIAAVAAPVQVREYFSMSTIGSPDPRLNRAGLEPLNGQASMDALHRRDHGPGAQDAALEHLRGPAASTPASDTRPATDLGEDVLNASAWDGVGQGQRMLAGDLGFESQLGAMPLSSAADSAADAILATLA